MELAAYIRIILMGKRLPLLIILPIEVEAICFRLWRCKGNGKASITISLHD